MSDPSCSPASPSVLHVGKYFPPHRGGMETFLADLMAAQQRAGTPVSALVHSSEPRLRTSCESVAVGDQRLKITRSAVWLTWVFAPLAPWFAVDLLRLLRGERPGVLHLHMPNPSVFWLLLLPAARALPWVVHWHSDVVASQHSRGLKLLYPVYRPLENAVLKRAAKIVATSPAYLESSAALQPHLRRCTVVPLGLDPGRLEAALEAASDTTTAKRTAALELLAVGRLTYYKGFATLIGALAQLPDARLTIVGTGALEDELREQISALGLGDRVTLAGALGDRELAAAFTHCDLLVLPSLERTEAFGLVLLEAMVVGKPVLASDVKGSGMPWLVRTSGAGELVEPGDSSALAQRLLELNGDRDKLRAFGAAGKRSFTNRFHIDSAVRSLRSLYRDVCEDDHDDRHQDLG